MANYVLSLDRGKKNYIEILWSNIFKSSELNKYLLKDIDDFTTSFKDGNELKEKLIISGLIDVNDYNKKLCIRYKSNGRVKKLGYGIAYSDDKVFLNDAYIIKYLESNIDNTVLLEKLCNHYRHSYIQGTNISAIRNYINKRKSNNRISDKDINYIYTVLKDFVIREVYNYDELNYEYKVDIEGNPIIKYKSIHDLGMFLAYDYRKKFKSATKLNETDNIFTAKVKVKVKRKKDNNFPGQIKLFDYFN